MKTTEKILDRINSIPAGVVFDYSDLTLSANMVVAASKALSRMVEENKLKRAGKGKFYKPVYSRLGEMTPPIDELTKDLLFKDGRMIGYITGIPIFAQMGLTTQISSKILIGSVNYRRPLVRGAYEISFTRQENVISEENVPLLRYLDAIRLIKKIPDCTPDEAVRILLAKLRSFSAAELKSLLKLSLPYPVSTKALLGAMWENVGLDAEILKLGFNPLTKYNIGLSKEVLPNKSNWNIQ